MGAAPSSDQRSILRIRDHNTRYIDDRFYPSGAVSAPLGCGDGLLAQLQEVSIAPDTSLCLTQVHAAPAQPRGAPAARVAYPGAPDRAPGRVRPLGAVG